MGWEFRIYIHVTDAEGPPDLPVMERWLYLGKVRGSSHQSKSIHVEREGTVEAVGSSAG